MKLHVFIIFILGMFSMQNSNSETLFADKSLWLSANNMVVDEVFGVDIPDSVQLNLESGIVITGTNPVGNLLNNNIENGQWEFRVYNSGGSNGYDSFVIDLPFPVFSFGIELLSINSTRGVSIKGNWDGTGEESTLLFDHFGNSSAGFFGVIGDQLFDQVTISTESQVNPGDDLAISTFIYFEDTDTIFNNGFE